MKLINHLHLVLKLRMCGTIPLLPQYALMVWKGKTSLLLLQHNIPGDMNIQTRRNS